MTVGDKVLILIHVDLRLMMSLTQFVKETNVQVNNHTRHTYSDYFLQPNHIPVRTRTAIEEELLDSTSTRY